VLLAPGVQVEKDLAYIVVPALKELLASTITPPPPLIAVSDPAATL
jgi:hypothetical protein